MGTFLKSFDSKPIGMKETFNFALFVFWAHLRTRAIGGRADLPVSPNIIARGCGADGGYRPRISICLSGSVMGGAAALLYQGADAKMRPYCAVR